MKFAFLILLFAFQSTSFADAIYTCKARQLFRGSQARVGKVVLNTDTFEVSWVGNPVEDVIAAGTICAAPVVAGGCYVQDLPQSLVVRRVVHCGAVTADFVMSLVGMNGRAECQSAQERNIIEFAHCQPGDIRNHSL